MMTIKLPALFSTWYSMSLLLNTPLIIFPKYLINENTQMQLVFISLATGQFQILQLNS